MSLGISAVLLELEAGNPAQPMYPNMYMAYDVGIWKYY